MFTIGDMVNIIQMVVDTNKNKMRTIKKKKQYNRSTQEPMTNNDENTDMIATNEVTPVKHTESADINEKYMEEVSKLTAIVESSTEFEQSTYDDGLMPANTTEINSNDINLSKIISVICIWC